MAFRDATSSTADSAPPASATAGASNPLSGPTKMPVPPATDTAIARRLDPTPGSTTAITMPRGTYGTARASASDPARTSNGATSCVMSITVACGATSAMTHFTTPTNSSRVP